MDDLRPRPPGLTPEQIAARNRLVQAAYEDLRRRVRTMSRGAPATLAGTAGVNAVLERVLLGSRTEWRGPEHFLAYCLRTLRCMWLNRQRDRSLRESTEMLAAIRAVTRHAEGAEVGSPPLEVLSLLDALRRDRRVKRRTQIARAAECHLVAGLTLEETAGALRVDRATAVRRLAAFRAWARVELAADLDWIRAALDAVASDVRLRGGPRIAEVARRWFLEGASTGEIAAALACEPARVSADLAVFRAWMAARDGAGAKGARVAG